MRDVHRRHADRLAVELALELRDDLASALAAPVDDGIMFSAAARARRRSPLRCGMSRTA